MTVGVPMSSASVLPWRTVKVSVVAASTGLLSAISKRAGWPSATVPASPTVSTGTSAPALGLSGVPRFKSLMVACPVSPIPAGSGVPDAVAPVSVPTSSNVSLPSNTPSSTVGTDTTIPSVVPAATGTL
ncbi:hypothetical protein [Pectobacterium parmentieri]|uniref:hypothetical protein n=1 Tax=Pectobacterium parmentieri TaxID=1905730 RepID=UPI002B248D5F|nr:hypothetical protein [Pectobacterium parmentieri]